MAGATRHYLSKVQAPLFRRKYQSMPLEERDIEKDSTTADTIANLDGAAERSDRRRNSWERNCAQPRNLPERTGRTPEEVVHRLRHTRLDLQHDRFSGHHGFPERPATAYLA